MPSAYKQFYCKIGPINPCNLPSEVSRESTLNPGHLNLIAVEQGSRRPRRPAGEVASLAPWGAVLTWSLAAARASRTCDGKREAPPLAGVETRRGTRSAEGRGRSQGAPGPGEEKLSFRRCQSNCSSQGCTEEGRHKFERGSNLFFCLRFILNEHRHLNSI